MTMSPAIIRKLGLEAVAKKFGTTRHGTFYNSLKLDGEIIIRSVISGLKI